MNQEARPSIHGGEQQGITSEQQIAILRSLLERMYLTPHKPAETGGQTPTTQVDTITRDFGNSPDGATPLSSGMVRFYRADDTEPLQYMYILHEAPYDEPGTELGQSTGLLNTDIELLAQTLVHIVGGPSRGRVEDTGQLVVGVNVKHVFPSESDESPPGVDMYLASDAWAELGIPVEESEARIVGVRLCPTIDAEHANQLMQGRAYLLEAPTQ